MKVNLSPFQMSGLNLVCSSSSLLALTQHKYPFQAATGHCNVSSTDIYERQLSFVILTKASQKLQFAIAISSKLIQLTETYSMRTATRETASNAKNHPACSMLKIDKEMLREFCGMRFVHDTRASAAWPLSLVTFREPVGEIWSFWEKRISSCNV